MTRPRLLDLFSGAGGCARGYQLAGFHVTGVDIAPQPRAYYGKKGWLRWTPLAANVQRRGRTPLLRGSVDLAEADMGIDWMTWDELREAIPPAYCEWIGIRLMASLQQEGVA